MIDQENIPFLIVWFICGTIAIFGTLGSKGIVGKKRIKLTAMILIGIACFLFLLIWLDGIWGFVLMLLVIATLGQENLKEVYNKLFKEKDFTHDIVTNFGIKTVIKFFGLIAVMFLWNTQFFTVNMSNMETTFQTQLDSLTQPLGKPNKISSKASELFYLQYDYTNPSSQALDILTKNIKTQKVWQPVAKENMQYPESNIAEYCNKEITLMISKGENRLSVETRWERGSYCHKNYGSPLVVPTTD